MKDISSAAVIILTSGAVAVIALLLAKLLMVIRHRKFPQIPANSSGYESGFKNEEEGFEGYQTEKHPLISVYLLIELATIWLLVCGIFDISANDWSGKIFIRVLIVVILLSLFISHKSLFPKK